MYPSPQCILYLQILKITVMEPGKLYIYDDDDDFI